MTTKYKNSPLVETVCEFQLIHNEEWDSTIPGVLYEKVKDSFPIKRQRKDFYQIPGQTFDGINNLTVLTQFYNKEESALIQTGKNTLTINCLVPYPHWERYKPMILDAFEKYKTISSPVGLRKISLKYINKILIPINGEIELKEFFNFYPTKPDLIPEAMGALDVAIQIPFNDTGDSLMLRLASVNSENPKDVAFLFQIDYEMIVPNRISFENIDEWLEHAHSKINSTFESSITEKSRNIFNK